MTCWDVGRCAFRRKRATNGETLRCAACHERKGRTLADAGRRRTCAGGGNAAAETLVSHEAMVRALHCVDGEREEEVLMLILRDT